MFMVADLQYKNNARGLKQCGIPIIVIYFQAQTILYSSYYEISIEE